MGKGKEQVRLKQQCRRGRGGPRSSWAHQIETERLLARLSEEDDISQLLARIPPG